MSSRNAVQINQMLATPMNPHVHAGASQLREYYTLTDFFRRNSPNSTKLYIIAGDQDRIGDPVQARIGQLI